MWSLVACWSVFMTDPAKILWMFYGFCGGLTNEGMNRGGDGQNGPDLLILAFLRGCIGSSSVCRWHLTTDFSLMMSNVLESSTNTSYHFLRRPRIYGINCRLKTVVLRVITLFGSGNKQYTDSVFLFDVYRTTVYKSPGLCWNFSRKDYGVFVCGKCLRRPWAPKKKVSRWRWYALSRWAVKNGTVGLHWFFRVVTYLTATVQ